MRCAICKNKTNWNSSYGYENFIVCPKCHDAITKEYTHNRYETMNIIFMLGRIGEGLPLYDENDENRKEK